MSTRLYPGRRVLWMPIDHAWSAATPLTRHCCEAMELAIAHDCDQHADPFDCPDMLVVFHELFGEYGLPIRDGGASYLLVSHCPFCGASLPASYRDAWFDAIEAAGLDDVPFAELPDRFRTAEWRRT